MKTIQHLLLAAIITSYQTCKTACIPLQEQQRPEKSTRDARQTSANNYLAVVLPVIELQSLVKPII